MVMPAFQIDQPILTVAAREARELGHTFVAPEHLLLAAIGGASAAGQTFCARHGLSPEAVRESIRELIGPVRSDASDLEQPLMLALRSQVALAKALERGLSRGDPQFTPDELLLALCDDAVAGRGVVGALLERAGLTPAAARTELAALAADGS